MENIDVRTYRDSKLVDLFACYIIYRKENGTKEIGELEIERCFWNAIGGLDQTYSSEEFVLAMKDDFDHISKVLGTIADKTSRGIRARKGIHDKYSNTETYYTVPDIEARWEISGTAVRKAIVEERLKAKEQDSRKCKYLILKEDFERYAVSNGIKPRII